MKKNRRLRSFIGVFAIIFSMAAALFGPLTQTETALAFEINVPVYRLYAASTGEHLYTTDFNEVSVLTSKYNWTYEGTAWYAPKTGVPVYRLFNAGLNNHLYTSDTNEVSVLTSEHGWVADNNGNPLFYSGGTVNIYRLYNEPLNGMHLLSTDENEYNTLPDYGWEQEGVKLLAVKNGNPIPSEEIPTPEPEPEPEPVIDIGAAQQQVVDIVNEERAKNGLGALTSTVELQNAAFVRATEISTYFSHTRPNGKSCFTVFNECGVEYGRAGENIAMGQSDAKEVMEDWMNSPGHRANILTPEFNHIGVGYYIVDGYPHWVQLFTN